MRAIRSASILSVCLVFASAASVAAQTDRKSQSKQRPTSTLISVELLTGKEGVGLPGPVGAEQAEHFAPLHLQ